jgi:hypothetical protein
MRLPHASGPYAAALLDWRPLKSLRRGQEGVDVTSWGVDRVHGRD